jgi:hypothetical protein
MKPKALAARQAVDAAGEAVAVAGGVVLDERRALERVGAADGEARQDVLGELVVVS